MSHRVTTETQMKDKHLAAAACKAAGVQYTEQGDTFRFTGGKLNNATLDLKTGRITGDTDYGHTTETLGALRQHYGEAMFKQESIKNGVSIESRTVNAAGEIILMWARGLEPTARGT